MDRYNNIKQDYMLKISRSKDDMGQYVIYVAKCEKYEYENPEIPPNPVNRFRGLHKTKK